MELELISHPKYGVIRDFTDELFMEIFDERPTRQYEFPGRTLDGAERMVQVSLPFL
jgi:hypothetical protein